MDFNQNIAKQASLKSMVIGLRRVRRERAHDSQSIWQQLYETWGGLFIKLDLAQSFHQMPLFPDNNVKSAMSMRFEWPIAPFCRTNIPSVIQIAIRNVFLDYADACVVNHFGEYLYVHHRRNGRLHEGKSIGFGWASENINHNENQ